MIDSSLKRQSSGGKQEAHHEEAITPLLNYGSLRARGNQVGGGSEKISCLELQFRFELHARDEASEKKTVQCACFASVE